MAVQLGAKALMSIVKIKENGVEQEFYVVRHNAYTSGRTLLLRRYIHSDRQWHSAKVNAYASSTLDAWFNGEYFNSLPVDIRGQIAAVSIPYTPGNGNNALIDLSRRVFAVSSAELGVKFPLLNIEGIELPDTAALRASTDGAGTVKAQWTRTPYLRAGGEVYPIYTGHYAIGSDCTSTYGARPAFTLPSSLTVEDHGSVRPNTAPSAPASISIPSSIAGGTTITVSWSAAGDAEGNLAGYIVEKSINGGSSWTQIYQGGALSTADAVVFGTPTVMYRVKSYDSEWLQSGYCTGNQVTVVNNRAPSAPPNINVPLAIEGGKNITVTWNAASDLDGNLAGYCLEQSVDGAAFAEIFRGNALSHALAITKGWSTATYRVRCYDAYSVFSGYTTSPTRTINNNTPPVISCASASGSDLGVKSAGFSISYTVSDAENNAVSVTEAADGVTKRVYNATLGAANSFAVTGEYFMKLLNGVRTMSVTAGDGKVSTVHTLRFTKSVTAASCTMENAMTADAQITVAAVSVLGSIPMDATYSVKVTNNAKDDAPVWEDCTTAVKSGANHVFVNKAATNGYAFNFQLSVSRGASNIGGHITSIQGGYQ